MRVLVIVDACQSGGATTQLAATGGLRALRLLARSAGVHILAATDRDQLAVELTRLGHGALTYAVLEALRGEATRSGNVVNLRALFRHVTGRVPLLTERYAGYAQYPTYHSRGADFPLVALR